MIGANIRNNEAPKIRHMGKTLWYNPQGFVRLKISERNGSYSIFCTQETFKKQPSFDMSTLMD